MTGGIGYFYDAEGDLGDKVNMEIVTVQRVITKAGEAQLKGLIEAHAAKTGSDKAKALLANWEAELPKFWQLVPPAERQTPECNPILEQQLAGQAVAVSA